MNAYAYTDDAAAPMGATTDAHAIAEAVGESAARASQGAEAAQVARCYARCKVLLTARSINMTVLTRP